MVQNPSTPGQGNPYQGTNPYQNPPYQGAGSQNGPNPQQARPNSYPNVAGISSLAQQAFPGSQFGAPNQPQQPAVPSGVLSGIPPANLEEQNLYGTQVPTNEEAVSFIQVAQQLSIEPLILANFLMDHVVILSGAVRGPGVYFGSPALTLDVLIAAAGGASNWADESGIDVVSTRVDRSTGVAATQRETIKMALAATYTVRPRDQVRVHEVYANSGIGSVTLQGEFRFAGNYQITRGEHLSQLLAQAGGLTDFAYPYGTIFLRRSAANLEAQGYQRAADEIQSQLIGAMTRVTSSATNRLSPNDFTSLQTFVYQLRMQKPLGRISIVADPSLIAAKPSLDPLLEPGDVIYMPQRPSTVTVLGQVSQPGSFPFEENAGARDYIEDAGGFAQYADSSTTFIVLPNGKAEKLNDSWFNLERRTIPPGSTIVVPRDLEPYDNRQLILDITQIMSQLAISAASLAVLANQ
jgi:protein involved in polysaccharide export with SLBB domain